MIKNPIFPGFNPDPCFCRKGDDYYIAAPHSISSTAILRGEETA